MITSIEGAVGALSYAIGDADIFQSDPIFTDLQDGEYLIKVIDEAGCTFDTITRLEAGNIIELEAIDALTVDESESVTITTNLNQSGQEISYQWLGLDLESADCDTCNAITFDAFESQILTVIGTDENGCNDKAEIEITVNELSDLWLANVFSPSVSNFRNQTLPIYFAPFVRSVESIRAYDRYGNNILSLTDMNPEDINIIWDGRYNGKLVENDVYTFVIQYTLNSGDSFTVTRNVTIIQ
jgi:gliding motility-associated-like protein